MVVVQVTVVPSDKLIIVNGEALVFEYFAPENIHAIQWHSGKGTVEYVGGAVGEAEYAKHVQRYVGLWEEEKAKPVAE